MTDPTNSPASTPGLSRRSLLGGVVAIGAGLVVVAACSDDSNDAGTETTGGVGTVAGATTMAPTTMAPATTMAPGTDAPAEANVDLTVAGLAAGLEVLAVGTYQAAADAAGAGDLGDVPPAVGEFVTVAMAQHQQHLDAWNKVLTDAGMDAVTEPNADLKPMVDEAFGKVKDVAGAAELALLLEQTAAATYLDAQKLLTDAAAIQLAGSIQITDAQHAAILLYVLGEYPVPDTFAQTELSAA